MERKDVLFLVSKELQFGDANYPKFNSPHEGYAIIKEEVDEFWSEIKLSKERKANKLMINEAIQIAARAIKFIENLYNIKGEER